MLTEPAVTELAVTEPATIEPKLTRAERRALNVAKHQAERESQEAARVARRDLEREAKNLAKLARNPEYEKYRHLSTAELVALHQQRLGPIADPEQELRDRLDQVTAACSPPADTAPRVLPTWPPDPQLAALADQQLAVAAKIAAKTGRYGAPALAAARDQALAAAQSVTPTAAEAPLSAHSQLSLPLSASPSDPCDTA